MVKGLLLAMKVEIEKKQGTAVHGDIGPIAEIPQRTQSKTGTLGGHTEGTLCQIDTAAPSK